MSIMITVTTIGDNVPDLLRALTGPQPTWMKEGACTTVGPNFADNVSASDEAAAAAHCIAACPVRGECLAHALEGEIRGNKAEMIVWGGLTPTDLRRLHRLLNPTDGTPRTWRTSPKLEDSDTFGTPHIEARLRGALECLLREVPDQVDIDNVLDALNALTPRSTPKRRNRLDPVPRSSCGTHTGWRAHHYHGEQSCRPCLDARNEWQRNYRASRRCQPTP